MRNLEITLQTFTLFTVSVCILPRFFTPYALAPSTVLIILFWIPPLVLFPEFIKDYSSKKFSLCNLPKFTILISSICVLISISSIFGRDILWNENSNSTIDIIRRSLYFINPILCFCYYPLINIIKRKEFIRKFIFLSLAFLTSVGWSLIIDNTFIGKWISNLTAKGSAKMLSVFTEYEISVNGNTFLNDDFAVSVTTGCSSAPTIFLSLFTMIVFYVCCKIKSITTLIVLLLINPPVIFLLNTIRVTILGYIVSLDKIELFDFLHEGLGSLFFSVVVMSFSCSIYYYFWNKENPINENEIENKIM